jgi:GNAT superfamily N-acetyltransferase
MAPEKVHRAVVKRAQGHYCLCPIHVDGEDLDGLRDEYKSLGYRLNGTEFFMVHGLKRIPRVDAPVPLEPVTTPEMVARLAKRAARRQILTEHLTEDPAPQRSYVALIDDLIVGWVNSIVTDEAAYCGGMYVYPEFRRRGIARSLLARMLRDDRAGGAQQAVLLASHAGAKLYPVVGYRQLGTMMVLTPKRR